MAGLFKAVESGDLDRIKELHGQGVPLDSVDEDGGTPMHVACFKGRLDVIQWLFGEGVALDVQSKMGTTPMHMTCANGHLEVVKWLFGKGVPLDVQEKNGSTPVHAACYHGHLEVVKWLFGKGVALVQNKDGSTPMHAACFVGHLEIAKWLFGKGVALDLPDKYGDTPMHGACFGGHLEMVKWLFGKSANPSVKNTDGLTPLQLAKVRGHGAVVAYLEAALAAAGAVLLRAAESGDLDRIKALPRPLCLLPRTLLRLLRLCRAPGVLLLRRRRRARLLLRPPRRLKRQLLLLLPPQLRLALRLLLALADHLVCHLLGGCLSPLLLLDLGSGPERAQPRPKSDDKPREQLLQTREHARRLRIADCRKQQLVERRGVPRRLSPLTGRRGRRRCGFCRASFACRASCTKLPAGGLVRPDELGTLRTHDLPGAGKLLVPLSSQVSSDHLVGHVHIAKPAATAHFAAAQKRRKNLRTSGESAFE